MKCKNCGSEIKDGAKYCEMCGARMGGEAFEPEDNLMQCIYGPPPVERRKKMILGKKKEKVSKLY